MSASSALPAVWLPAIRTGTGTDVFTQRLSDGLNARGIRTEITWLPHRAEYLPWTVAPPSPPAWANIVHLNTWVHRRFIPTGLRSLATMHLCVHDPALAPYKSRLQRWYHRHWIKPMEAHLLGRVGPVVAVSRYTAQRTQEAFGRQDVVVIPNGVPISPEWGDPERFERRTPGQPFRLLYVGNWSRRKGVDLLAPIMRALGAEFELAYTADANAAHEEARLPPNCRCIGRLGPDELQRAYRASDALLFPSRLEGLPLSVIEAMAQGLPVVAAASSSLPELIDDGRTGLLFGTDDVDAAVRQVRRLAQSPALQALLSRAGREQVENSAGLEGMIDAYARLYQQMITEGSPRVA